MFFLPADVVIFMDFLVLEEQPKMREQWPFVAVL